MRITVDEAGRVIEAEPLCGPRELYDACVAAARQARFTPTLMGGQPVKVKGTITYNFVIR
ncbi:MAG: energy transducer TonB [Acidobacteria bacterium]|nr:energy transducer TonB [Acidobacteriota bacterium]